MASIVEEITALEGKLRQAELDWDAEFFESILADDAVMVHEGQITKSKKMVVDAHREGSPAPRFSEVEMSNMEILPHGEHNAVVTVDGVFTTGGGMHIRLRFLRVWAKAKDAWQIVGGAVIQND